MFKSYTMSTGRRVAFWILMFMFALSTIGLLLTETVPGVLIDLIIPVGLYGGGAWLIWFTGKPKHHSSIADNGFKYCKDCSDKANNWVAWHK